MIQKHQFTARINSGVVRLVWLSLDGKGSVSIGVNEADFRENGRGEKPHLTFHPFRHHLTGDPKPFEGIAMLDMMLDQERVIRWATATTNPLCRLPTGRQSSNGKVEISHEVWTPSSSVSASFEVTLARPYAVSDAESPSRFVFRDGDLWAVVDASVVPAQPASLSWSHYY